VLNIENANRINDIVVELYSLTGSKTHSMRLPAQQRACPLNISCLPGGLYIIKADQEGQQCFVKILNR